MTLLKIISPSVNGRKAGRWLGIFPPKEYTPNYASLILAGLTDGMDIKIQHQSIDAIDYREGDLIAITGFTNTAPIMYELADRHREHGKTVVLGGVHVWAMPEEAMQHADAIVVGEAEGIWQQVIEDFNNGQLKQRYDASALDEWRISPRRDLIVSGKFMEANIIQTSRGCPHDCEFCSVTAYQGRKMRHRPVDDVIAEIESLKGRRVFFLDDNISGDLEYSKELLERLIPYQKRWYGQAPSYIAENSEWMELARRSGCEALFIGFESISDKSLRETGKGWNKNLSERIKLFHDYGIYVVGSFIFGFDNDDITVFDRTVDFALENNIEIVNFGILTPLPGSKLFRRLEEEGRILSYDWSKYDAAHVVFQPKQVTPEELQQGLYRAYERFYTFSSVLSAMRDPKFLFPITFSFWNNYRNINQRQREVDNILQNEQLEGFLQRWRGRAVSVQYYLADKKRGAHEFVVRTREGLVDRLTVPYEKLKIPLKHARDFKLALADRIRLITNASRVTYL